MYDPQITCLLGTRAQLIKMAPVIREFERRQVPVSLVLTGQHRESMVTLMQDLDIRTKPIQLLQAKEASGIVSMGLWLPRAIWCLLRDGRRLLPRSHTGSSYVLVHGDTFSTLLGALIGKLRGIRVVHIEAGLRSYNLLSPFPEELTRLITFRLADVGFCPGKWAAGNLRNYRLLAVDTEENTLLDAVRYAISRCDLEAAPVPGETYCVASIHRFENIFRRSRLEKIVELLEHVAKRFRIVFVVHPATRKRLERTGFLARLGDDPQFTLAPRMGYVSFIRLMNGARFVITDGGSNQEELSYLGIPTLLMRRVTERQEGLGDTATLCNYEREVVDRFLEKVDATWPRPTPEQGLSERAQPSSLIVDWFQRRHFEEQEADGR